MSGQISLLNLKNDLKTYLIQTYYLFLFFGGGGQKAHFLKSTTRSYGVCIDDFMMCHGLGIYINRFIHLKDFVRYCSNKTMFRHLKGI